VPDRDDPRRLGELLAAAARGHPPPADGGLSVLAQPSARDAGVIAFTAHNVVFADVDPDWVRARVPDGDLSVPLNPPFLRGLEERLDRLVNNIDMLTFAAALPGPPPLELTCVPDHDHPRACRARRHRDDVRVWTCPGGVLILGRGVAGRWEIAVEVARSRQGHGLGRLLARAGRHLVPAGGPLWGQISPGNAASVRAFLAAGFTPVGAEALLVPR
jgi:hypothetical protein